MERELRDEGANFGRSQGQDCYCALAVVKVRGDGFVRTEQGSLLLHQRGFISLIKANWEPKKFTSALNFVTKCYRDPMERKFLSKY